MIYSSMNINDIKFQDLAQAKIDYGADYAQKQAYYDMIEESKKSVLASIASAFEWAEATRERQARCSDEFKLYLAKVQKARIEAINAKMLIDAIDMRFEWCRSVNSRAKKEMDLL